jgi:hypothetical protein
MQRDLDLIRKILFALEAKPDPKGIQTLEIEGYDNIMVRYHLNLLAQAKLIDYEPELAKTGRIIKVIVFNPSWLGYEFRDAVRSDAVWSKLKSQAADKGTALPFDVLKTIATEVIKNLFGV